MRLRPLLVIGGLFAVIALAIVLSSCGSSSSTSPGPGGGGGAGPSFDLSFPATGASRTFTFAAGDTGTWGYQCSPHGSCCGMKGAVVVSATAVGESALVTVGSGNSLTFSPDTVRIKPGRTVRWVNASSATNHTATR